LFSYLKQEAQFVQKPKLKHLALLKDKPH